MIKKYKGDPRQKFQGDISFIKLNKVEIEFSPLPNEGLILAEGEITGHKHLLVADREAKVQIARDNEGYFIKVLEGKALIKHQEHEVQILTPGIYFSGRQWEWNEIDEKKVVD